MEKQFIGGDKAQRIRTWRKLSSAAEFSEDLAFTKVSSPTCFKKKRAQRIPAGRLFATLIADLLIIKWEINLISMLFFIIINLLFLLVLRIAFF